MSDPSGAGPIEQLAPVHAEDYRPDREGWAWWLVVFLRVAAGLAMIKGLYHWSAVCGFGARPGEGFDAQSLSWQTATVFFAVIDLVAAVGLWLAAPWGAVVWLTGSVTMIVVQVFFPLIYGFHWIVVVGLVAMIGAYLFFAVMAAREQPA
ncbi:hypothetical protein CCR97_21710 [Rhodoplanes elegans]|uniref:DoxX family protein n=1 Tax=Rhodoplanes elegans TaxID=29408 RepID=A0A327KQE1_9BRAD|nr:DUF6163 family protein [Rhodoplanes elegans]MBK5960800.1 hypothetical protein [Rhodoplanes elegans]RAI39843.1 hypothetical protein CH338_08100 [Rhodoplanes elegans]